jgi:hypothetical protein
MGRPQFTEQVERPSDQAGADTANLVHRQSGPSTATANGGQTTLTLTNDSGIDRIVESVSLAVTGGTYTTDLTAVVNVPPGVDFDVDYDHFPLGPRTEVPDGFDVTVTVFNQSSSDVDVRASALFVPYFGDS